MFPPPPRRLQPLRATDAKEMIDNAIDKNITNQPSAQENKNNSNAKTDKNLEKDKPLQNLNVTTEQKTKLATNNSITPSSVNSTSNSAITAKSEPTKPANTTNVAVKPVEDKPTGTSQTSIKPSTQAKQSTNTVNSVVKPASAVKKPIGVTNKTISSAGSVAGVKPITTQPKTATPTNTMQKTSIDTSGVTIKLGANSGPSTITVKQSNGNNPNAITIKVDSNNVKQQQSATPVKPTSSVGATKPATTVVKPAQNPVVQPNAVRPSQNATPAKPSTMANKPIPPHGGQK